MWGFSIFNKIKKADRPMTDQNTAIDISNAEARVKKEFDNVLGVRLEPATKMFIDTVHIFFDDYDFDGDPQPINTHVEIYQVEGVIIKRIGNSLLAQIGAMLLTQETWEQVLESRILPNIRKTTAESHYHMTRADVAIDYLTSINRSLRHKRNHKKPGVRVSTHIYEDSQGHNRDAAKWKPGMPYGKGLSFQYGTRKSGRFEIRDYVKTADPSGHVAAMTRWLRYPSKGERVDRLEVEIMRKVFKSLRDGNVKVTSEKLLELARERVARWTQGYKGWEGALHSPASERTTEPQAVVNAAMLEFSRALGRLAAVYPKHEFVKQNSKNVITDAFVKAKDRTVRRLRRSASPVVPRVGGMFDEETGEVIESPPDGRSEIDTSTTAPLQRHVDENEKPRGKLAEKVQEEGGQK